MLMDQLDRMVTDQERMWTGAILRIAMARLDRLRTCSTSVASSSNMDSNCFITNSQMAQNLDSRTRTTFCNAKKAKFRQVCKYKGAQ